MPRETLALPKSAMRAIRLARANFERLINDIGLDALEDLQKSHHDGWTVDFDAGFATRTTPERAPADTSSASDGAMTP